MGLVVNKKTLKKKMKTRIPIIVIVVLSMIIIIPEAFASCIVNEDWPGAPCLDTIGNGWYDQDEVDQWSNYYSYKGADFMEKKFFQLDTAIAEDRLEQWVNESQVNQNVYEYYFFSGRAPNIGWHNAQFHLIPINENPADKRDFTFLDSVIVTSPDFDLEVAFLVTTPDDCHGKKDGSNWEWIDQECVLSDPPADYKTIPRKYIFAAPLKQIKAGVAMVDIQCNDGKNVVYKQDRMRAACVTAETENQLIFHRDWGAMRLGMPAEDDQGPNLCDRYGGIWDGLKRLCHGLKYPLLCSMSGGDVTESSCFIPGRAMESSSINNFEECAAAGNPVMESYPRQCRTPDGKHFVEEIESSEECFIDSDCPEESPVCLRQKYSIDDMAFSKYVCVSEEEGSKIRDEKFQSCLISKEQNYQDALEKDGKIFDIGDPKKPHRANLNGVLVQFLPYMVNNLSLDVKQVMKEEYQLDIIRMGGSDTVVIVYMPTKNEVETFCTLELDNRIMTARSNIDWSPIE